MIVSTATILQATFMRLRSHTLRPKVKDRRPQTTDRVPEVAVYADIGSCAEFK
jgi:hypothetical protein